MPDPGMLDSADPFLASLRALPMGVHVVLGIGMAAGLVLWLAGGRVIRPMFALIGVVFGAALGFFLAPMLATEPIHDIPTPYLGLGVGSMLGLAITVALFRFTMALTAGIVLAIAGMMGTSVYLKHADPAPIAEASPRVDEPIERDARPTRDALWREVADRVREETSPEDSAVWAREGAVRTREFLGRAGTAASERWQQVPDQHRLMVVGGGLGGGVMGFVLGVFVPRRAAALITALFGSALWLSCATWTAHATGAPGLEMLRQPTQVWAVIWPVTAAVGMCIQWLSIVHARKSGG